MSYDRLSFVKSQCSRDKIMCSEIDLRFETPRDESCHEMLMAHITSSPLYVLNFDFEKEERKVCHFEFSSVWKMTKVVWGAGMTLQVIFGTCLSACVCENNNKK